MMKEYRENGNKTVLITGATSGIGKEAAIALARMGMKIIITSRDKERGERTKEEIINKSKNKEVYVMLCDLASFESIKDFASNYIQEHNKLNILINNAGVWESERKVSADGIELTFAVNHLAPFLLTNLLTETLKKSAPSRIITISSSAHRFGKINFDDIEGVSSWSSMNSYAQSKLANILFTKKTAELLKEHGITSNCLHPGVVKTSLFDKLPKWQIKFFNMLMVNVEKGAATTVFLASSPEVEGITGKYFKNCKIKKSSASSQNAQNIDRLWKISSQITGLSNK